MNNKNIHINSQEHMTNHHVVIADKETIRDALRHTHYLTHFNEVDISSRDLPPLNNTDLVAHYMDHMIIPNATHIIMLNKMIDTIYNELRVENRKRFLRTIWKFAIFSGLENNFPHTHHDIIFIPMKLINMNLNNRMTFVHEKVHIHQKQFPQLYENLYKHYWHFKKIDNGLVADLPFKLRSNPDVLENNWLFTYKGANIIMLVKYRDNAKNITDVDYIGYNIDTKDYKPLKDIPQYTDFFGTFNLNYYHPYEIIAEMIPDHCYNKADINNKAYGAFLKWWKKIE
jgi:hypothetical protein